MRQPLLLLLLTATFRLFAQNAALDSLQRRLRSLPPTDTSRVNLMLDIAVNHSLGGRDSLAKRTLEEGINLARRLGFRAGEARARLFWVRVESEYLADTPGAEAHLREAERLAKELGSLSLQGQTYYRRAQLYENIMTKVPEANRLLQQALRTFEQARDRRWQAMVFNEIAIMKMGEGKFPEAINLLLNARRIQEAINDWRGLRATLPNLSAAYVKMNRYDDALACFEAAGKVADRLNDDVIRMFVLGKRAEILARRGHHHQALDLYRRQAEFYREHGLGAQLAAAYGGMSRMYIHLKQYQPALDYTRRAEQAYRNTVEKSQDVMEHNAQANYGQIYLALGQYRNVLRTARKGLEWTESLPEMRPERTEYHRQLALAYEHLGQPAKALVHFKRYKAESDSMLNEEAIQKVTAASMTFNFEKKEQAARLQQARQQTRIQELENEKLTQTLRLVVVLLVAVAVVLGLVFWSNRRLRAKNEALARSKAEIESALFQGQTMERKRVASELHDSVASKVSALKWRFEAFDTDEFSPDQKREYDRLLGHLGEVYEDIRTISHNLMPEILEKQGLQAALLKLTDTLNVQNRTRFVADVEDSGPDVRGSAACELYAIALELVNNILRHAHADRADLRLQRRDDYLELTVQDDGRGFDPSRFTSGIGFKNMQYRLDRLGGSYDLDAPVGGGTSVRVQVPVGVPTVVRT